MRFLHDLTLAAGALTLTLGALAVTAFVVGRVLRGGQRENGPYRGQDAPRSHAPQPKGRGDTGTPEVPLRPRVGHPAALTPDAATAQLLARWTHEDRERVLGRWRGAA